MARSVSQIQQTILESIAANPVLNQLNSTSQVAIYNLFAYIISVSQNTEEEGNDAFVQDVENIVSILPPGTPNWIQNQAFLFQYSATNPQIIQFSTASFAPYYPVVNPALRIITNCSVTVPIPGQVNVLVAGGGTAGTGVPAAISTPQLQALQYYFNQVKPAGIIYSVISEAADNLFSAFTIYYLGIYASTIRASLLTAYTTYLNNINFGGTIYLAQIVAALLSVTGVTNVICNTMVARTAVTPFGLGTIMVTGNDWQITTYTTVAGYIIDETTSGKDFLTNLILIAS